MACARRRDESNSHRSPRPVDFSKYTVATLLSKKPAKIDKSGFRRVVKQNARTIGAYWAAKGFPENTAAVITKRLMRLWAAEKPGKRTRAGTGYELTFEFSSAMERAQEAARQGDAESADAFLSVARALRRMEKSVLPPPRSPQENFDRWVRKLANDGILD